MNTQIIRRRIRSITGTSQIAKAMEMVAASKMKKSQDKAMGSYSYALHAKLILGLIKKVSEFKVHPLLKKYAQIKRELLVIITSNKGLCGAYNLAIAKTALNYIKANPEVEFDAVVLGKKGQKIISQAGISIVADFSNLPPYPVSGDIVPLAELIRKAFLKNECQRVSVVYTAFYSTLRQTPKIEQILPISSRFLAEISRERQEVIEIAREYKFEPDQRQIFDFILPRLMEVRILQTVLESIASEHSSRMMAMKNASDNAKDIIADLRLTYNSVRQAMITQELAEITAGAEALG